MSVLYGLDLFGTAVFAVTGALAGVRKRMDVLGVLVLGLVTAVGGGTTRDLLLGVLPPFWIRNPLYPALALTAALVTFVFARNPEKTLKPLIFLDAVGLAAFTAVGAERAIAAEVNGLAVVILATMTAVVGGMIRDVLSGQVPLILRREIYATACILGALLCLLLTGLGIAVDVALFGGGVSVFLVRMVAVRFNLSLPRRSGTRPEGEA